MSSENGLWELIQPRLSTFLTLKRVENRCDLGTPDVAWTGMLPAGRAHGVMTYRVASGWLELKETGWPVRDLTPLYIKSLTLEQVLWHRDWKRAGGRIATLIQADADYLLVNPEVLRQIYRRELTRADLGRFVLGSRRLPVAAIVNGVFSS